MNAHRCWRQLSVESKYYVGCLFVGSRSDDSNLQGKSIAGFSIRHCLLPNRPSWMKPLQISVCLRASLLINVVGIRVKRKSGSCINNGWGKWQTRARGWLGGGASVFPTPARCTQEGSPSSLPASAWPFGKRSHHLLIYFSSYFPKLPCICQFLFLPWDAFNLAWNLLLGIIGWLNAPLAIFWLKSCPHQHLTGLLPL